jgi:hypothetical protein
MMSYDMMSIIYTPDNHLDNISVIRTRAIEIVNIFEMEFRWEKEPPMLHGLCNMGHVLNFLF